MAVARVIEELGAEGIAAGERAWEPREMKRSGAARGFAFERRGGKVAAAGTLDSA
ncbi:MAG: hypothetical protein QXT28_11840 [Thermofilaceae archaeon]